MRIDAGPDRLVLTAWGRTLAVEVPAGRLATLAILPRLPFGWRPASDHGVAERTWTLVADGATVLAGGGERLGRYDEGAAAVNALLADLELWVAEHARRHVFVHAGCAVLAGRAILVPGRTLAGKSSLTAALVRAGATYWSDEYAVLRPDGRVVPYAREAALRPRDDEGPGSRGGCPSRNWADGPGGGVPPSPWWPTCATTAAVAGRSRRSPPVVSSSPCWTTRRRERPTAWPGAGERQTRRLRCSPSSAPCLTTPAEKGK